MGSPEIILGGLAGTSVAYFFIWRRVRYIVAYWRYHKRNEELERALREAREVIAGASPYRAATADDAELVAQLAAGAADEAALAACGFTPIADGNIVVHGAQRPVHAVLRAFVDAAHMTCAAIVVTRKSPMIARLELRSFADGETFATARGVQMTIAEPPFVHRQMLAADLPHAQLVAQHRAFAHLDAAARSFACIASRDELLAALASAHADVARWRLAQPPDELLEADLRAAMGPYYGKLGKIWARRLRAPLPAASVRRG